MFQENSIETCILSRVKQSPAQAGCMRQALGPGALGKHRGSGWRGRWEGGSGWGTHVNPWLFHFNVWENPPQIKKEKKKKKEHQNATGYREKRKDQIQVFCVWDWNRAMRESISIDMTCEMNHEQSWEWFSIVTRVLWSG